MVHEEPRHRPLFQNSAIRLLDVRVPPGDTTQFHVHHTPSVFLFFTSTTTGSQLQGAVPSSSRSAAGTFLFENLAAPNSRIHRVWNSDHDTFRVMDVELLSQATGFVEQPLALPQLALSIDTPWARVYQLTLRVQEHFAFKNANRSLVLIAMAPAQVQVRQGREARQQFLQAGHFFLMQTGQLFVLKNKGSAIARFVLLEAPEQWGSSGSQNKKE